MHFQERLKNLTEFFREIGVDGLLITDPTSLYYMTGLELSKGQLLMTRDATHLIVDGRYTEIAKRQTLYQVSVEHDKIIPQLLTNATRIAFCKDNTSYMAFQSLQELLPDVELLPIEDPVMGLRLRKDPDELALMRQAAELGSEGFDFVYDLLTEGITEKEVALELELFWRRKGGSGVAFEPIIAFGPNSSMPHYRAGDAALKPGDTVLIDIGVTREHYHSDMTRVLFFGAPPPEMLHVYDVVLRAQQAALGQCRPGVTFKEIDTAARNVIREAGFIDFFTHGLGHGIGLEIHEPPFISRPRYAEDSLKTGMVITIEPGIYLPGVGGIRIEDTITITPEGHEDLTLRDKGLRII